MSRSLLNPTPSQTIGRIEFVIMMAVMLASAAFSIDALLPGMPQVAAEISPDAPTHAAWVLTAFVGGLGLGTFFAGPLSDAYGRKPVLYVGFAIYIFGAAAAWLTSSLEWMLVARVVQGIGASGPRIVSLAIIRDLYSGRDMAKIISFAMMIFILAPALAPAMGSVIIDMAGWRAVFGTFIAFGLICMVWMGLRLVEPLTVAKRRPLRIKPLMAAVAEVLGHRTVFLSIIVQTMMITMLFTTLTMIQPVFDQSFERANSFPFWFGMVALMSGGASLLNANIVTRYGMRAVVTTALSVQLIIGLSCLTLLALDTGYGFAIFMVWLLGLFCQAGMTVGNLNAIAMEPMGHIAGMAASVIGAISTVIGALIASGTGLLFDGTPVPLLGITCVLGASCLLLMARINRIAEPA